MEELALDIVEVGVDGGVEDFGAAVEDLDTADLEAADEELETVDEVLELGDVGFAVDEKFSQEFVLE